MIRKKLAGVLAAAAITLGLVSVSPAPAMASGGWYITNYWSARCLAPVNNSPRADVPVVLSNAPCPRTATWNFADDGGSFLKYIKLDANPVLCMVPKGESTVKNAAIITGICGTDTIYRWEAVDTGVEAGGHEYYQLANAMSHLCLAVVGNSTAAGASILQAPCSPHGNVAYGQRFTW